MHRPLLVQPLPNNLDHPNLILLIYALSPAKIRNLIQHTVTEPPLPASSSPCSPQLPKTTTPKLPAPSDLTEHQDTENVANGRSKAPRAKEKKTEMTMTAKSVGKMKMRIDDFR